MKIVKEFKEFAMKGNIIDLAVGVIIGGAFQKIVNSLVNDIVMPTIAVFTGKVDYTELSVTIGQSSIKYGSFLTAVINFLIIAISIFLVIRYMNKMNEKLEKIKEKEKKRIEKLTKKGQLKKLEKYKKNKIEEQEEITPTTKICPYCFSEININATRCAHCTSELGKETIKEEVKC